jgi:hypothetical protein
VLWADVEALERARAAMVAAWGPIDHEGPDHPFDVTGYYDDEMGARLARRLLAFERLVAPERLPEFKLAASAIEERLAEAGRRRVNIDVGYLDHHKVVLASAKPAGQKVYLGRGIWADIMFRCRAGRLEPFEWTFPDFRDGRYEPELLAVRGRYLEQLREARRAERAAEG